MITDEMETAVMNGSKFLREVIDPVLRKMPDMDSNAARKLLMMIACHESGGFQYRKQINGPALSYFQIEPDTLDDLYANYLIHQEDKKDLVNSFARYKASRKFNLEQDDKYACAVARMQLWRKPDPLPGENAPLLEFGNYAKQHWNTTAGKATPQKYVDDFKRYALREML